MKITPTHRRILCRRYSKPQKAGEIWLPEAFLINRTQTLWEVEAVGPCASEPCRTCQEELERNEEEFTGLGMQLSKDDIVQTERSWQSVSLYEALGEDLWMITAEHVAGVWPLDERESAP